LEARDVRAPARWAASDAGSGAGCCDPAKQAAMEAPRAALGRF